MGDLVAPSHPVTLVAFFPAAPTNVPVVPRRDLAYNIDMRRSDSRYGLCVGKDVSISRSKKKLKDKCGYLHAAETRGQNPA